MRISDWSSDVALPISGKCIDHSHGALSAERQQRSGNALAPVHVDNPCGDLVPVDQGLGCTVFAHRHRSNVAQQIAHGHRLTKHEFADLLERNASIAQSSQYDFYRRTFSSAPLLQIVLHKIS